MIEITSQQIDRVSKILQGIPGATQKALYNTVNRTLTTVRAKSATEIAKTYRISVGAAKGSGRMKVKPANGTSLTGSISFAGNVIPLIDFSVSYGKSGLVNASVMRKSGGAALKHAFVANLRYGTRVFERTSAKRDSSTQLYGPSIAHMVENEDVLNNIELEAMETADKRLEHEITRILNGYGG